MRSLVIFICAYASESWTLKAEKTLPFEIAFMAHLGFTDEEGGKLMIYYYLYEDTYYTNACRLVSHKMDIGKRYRPISDPASGGI